MGHADWSTCVTRMAAMTSRVVSRYRHYTRDPHRGCRFVQRSSGERSRLFPLSRLHPARQRVTTRHWIVDGSAVTRRIAERFLAEETNWAELGTRSEPGTAAPSIP